MSDDFYIGYEPHMPDALAPRIGWTAAALIGLACALGLTLALTQREFAPGVFEFGQQRQFEGTVWERPYPVLSVGSSRYWLVGPGKRGGAPLVAGLDGRRVRVQGTLIERDGDHMIQVDSVAPASVDEGRTAAAEWRVEGTTVLDGEIVDSKCHLGVMKPGDGPTHRDCAVRCLIGGVPPMLVVADRSRARRIALVSVEGRPLDWDLEPWAARPVQVRGPVYVRGTERFLGVEAAGISLRP